MATNRCVTDEASQARSRWLVALDLASLGLCALLGARLVARVEAPPPLAWQPLLAAAALAGWALADLASGIVHWAFDRFGREDTPLLGPALIHPFREHHRDPRAIVAHGFVELSGTNALAISPLLAAGGELAPLFGEALWPSAALSALVSACAGLFATNQIHRWAHAPRAPRVVRALRRLGFAIPPEAHALHHDGAHDAAFCITTGWWNPWLDRRAAFPRAERWLRARAPRRTRAAAESPAAQGSV